MTQDSESIQRTFFNYTKRFDCYFHIEKALNGSVQLRYPVAKNGAANHSPKWNGPLNMRHFDSVLLETNNLPGSEYVGGLEWVASAHGSKFPSRVVDVDLASGGAVGGNLANMLSTPSVPRMPDGTALSFGFWDSGGDFWRNFVPPLPAKDQVYVYLTRSHETWMGDLAAEEPKLNARPFGAFVLPSSHDAGMFDDARINSLLVSAPAQKVYARLLLALLKPYLKDYSVLVAAIAAALASNIADPIVMRRIMVNMAFTQKDNIKTQLDLGTRYFDFRPGYLHPEIKSLVRDDALYHQHKIIPGYPYKAFLVDVLEWLDAHPTEVVVVCTGSSGFGDSAMIPPPATLRKYLEDAQRTTGAAVKVGDKSDLKTPYERLVDKAVNRRLLMVDTEVPYYFSYGDAYNTTDPAPVLKELTKMNRAGQAGMDYTYLTLQATATGVTSVGAWGAMATTDATSPLMATKARFDHAIYPWLLAEIPKKGFDPDQLLVLGNDFVDNALTSHAIELTRTRVSPADQVPESTAELVEAEAR